ncbi:chemotaxis protein CheW [Haloarchaeobius amylolyticus]|uniref:Chemotaxis protein CheW n=1 Tax=Haloarchaeobius amylolyticus TaxID=1198296 RepID=A0ABD6BJF6_9EURY
MAPDLSEKLLGIDIDDADRTRESDSANGDDEEFVQFVFVRVGDHQFALPVDVVRTVTEPPTEVTRVPRTPPAIEGLMDLRGEITAVIDPRIHFPTPETDSNRERLVVFDRPSDQQSAAIRVDDVLGVEVVPESNVIDDDGVADSPLSGDALEHPLVVALVTQEREREREQSVETTTAGVSAGGDTDDGAGVFGTGTDDAATLSSAGDASGGFGSSIGEPFEIESADDARDDPDTDGRSDEPQETVLEATALIDVERLLLASGQQ